jgi:hypothetical protein
MLMSSHACSFYNHASIRASGRVEADDLPKGCLSRGARYSAFGVSSVANAEPSIKY